MNGESAKREIGSMDSVEQCRWRSALYQLASSAFLEEPSDEVLALQIVTARQAIEAQEGWKSPYEERLLQYLASLDETDNDLGRRIRSEYAELFVGPRPPLAPLYESIYRGSPRRLLTAVTREVRDAYEQCGFVVTKKNRVPDDHVGYEMEFMARLELQIAEALEQDDKAAAQHWHEASQQFIAEHLAQWVGVFAEHVREAVDGYYAAWAAFACDLVMADAGCER